MVVVRMRGEKAGGEECVAVGVFLRRRVKVRGKLEKGKEEEGKVNDDEKRERK